jgi:hypothetical protein
VTPRISAVFLGRYCVLSAPHRKADSDESDGGGARIGRMHHPVFCYHTPISTCVSIS